MPSQTDVQKLIQGLAPGAVNNGNPNTIYNTPGTVMGGTVSPAASMPAATNVQLPPVQTASQLGAWQAPTQQPLQLPTWSLQQMGTATPPVGTTPPVTTTPPPVTTPPGSTPAPPLQDPFGFGGFSEDGKWLTGPNARSIFRQDSPFMNDFTINSPEFRKAYGTESLPPKVAEAITDDKGNIDEGKAEGFFSNLLEGAGGKVMQFLDAVTEIFPVLNGIDWYKSDTGQFEFASNATQFLMNALGLGPVFRLFKKTMDNFRQPNAGSSGLDPGCVLVDSHIFGFGRAGDVKMGDTLRVIDPMTFEMTGATVSYSEAKLQPCVRITTKSGVVLECSESAPISDDVGEQILAADLLGVSIPVSKNGMIEFETVMKVESLGEQLVQHITCENNFFLAGKREDEYLLHHNAKRAPWTGIMDPQRQNPFDVGSWSGKWTAGGDQVYYGDVGDIEQVR